MHAPLPRGARARWQQYEHVSCGCTVGWGGALYTTRALIRLALTDNFSPAPPGRACYEQVTMGDIDRPGLEPQGPLRPTGLQPCFESAPAPRLTHRCAMLGFSLWGAPSLVLVEDVRLSPPSPSPASRAPPCLRRCSDCAYGLARGGGQGGCVGSKVSFGKASWRLHACSVSLCA